MKLNLNFWTFPFAVQFEQNKSITKDINALIVMEDTLGAHYQTALLHISTNVFLTNQLA